MNNINEADINSLPLPHNPILYIVLSHLVLLGKAYDRYVVIVDDRYVAKHLTQTLVDRLKFDNDPPYHVTDTTISMQNGMTVEFISMVDIGTHGLPNFDDNLTKVFFSLCKNYAPSTMHDVLHECVMEIVDGDSRDLFVGISTDDLEKCL